MPILVRGRRRRNRLGKRSIVRVGNNVAYNTWRIRRNVFSKSMLNVPKVHYFKRFTQFVTNGDTLTPISGLTNTAGVPTATVGLVFMLSNLPSFAEFSVLYDQICLTKVVIKFVPMRDKAILANSAPVGGISGGRLATCIDYDDGTAPATADAVREYASCKITDIDKIHKRVLTPAVLRQMYESNIATAYTPSFKQWISTTDMATPHYGLKVALISNDSAATSNSIQFSIEAKYYFKCRNTK